MHKIQNMWTVLKRLSWGILQQAKGTIEIEFTQIKWFLVQLDGRLDIMKVS
jgi:hypothetical protein